jgi:hypothetical protein
MQATGASMSLADDGRVLQGGRFKTLTTIVYGGRAGRAGR